MPIARNYFFHKSEDGDKIEGLYNTEDIRDRIESKFKHELEETPLDGSIRHNRNWLISAPQFLKKDQQRIYWASTITVLADCYEQEQIRYISTPAWLRANLSAGAATPWHPDYSSEYENILQNTTISMPAIGSLYATENSLRVPSAGVITNLPGITTFLCKGQTKFEIMWSVDIDENYGLNGEKVDSIKCLGTTWVDLDKS